MRTVEVTIPNRPRQYACHVHTVDVTQMLLKGQRRQIMEGRMGGSPKALRQHLAGETACWETTGVQPRLPGSQRPYEVEYRRYLCRP